MTLTKYMGYVQDIMPTPLVLLLYGTRPALTTAQVVVILFPTEYKQWTKQKTDVLVIHKSQVCKDNSGLMDPVNEAVMGSFILILRRMAS